MHYLHIVNVNIVQIFLGPLITANIWDNKEEEISYFLETWENPYRRDAI